MRRYELISGLTFFALGAAAAFEAVRLKVGSPGHPGPGFLPLILGTLLMLSSLALVLSKAQPRIEGRQPDAERSPWVGEARVPYAAAALIAYALVLEPLGYVLSTFGLLFMLFMSVWPKRRAVAAASAVVALICTYVLFGLWLNVRLPRGVLADWG